MQINLNSSKWLNLYLKDPISMGILQTKGNLYTSVGCLYLYN